MRLTLAAALAIATALLAPPARADRYISGTGTDTGTCQTSGTACRTLSYVDAGRVTAGETVHVAAGSYADVQLNTSGTSGNPITWVSEPKRAAKFTMASPDSYGIDLEGSWTVVDGFEFTGKGRGGIFNAGSNVVLQYNYAHDINRSTAATPCDGNGGAGIVSGTFHSPTNIKIYRNTLNTQGDAGCTTVHGAYIQTDHMDFQENILCSNQGAGVAAYGLVSSTNIINNLAFENGVDGIDIAGDTTTGHSPVATTNVFNNISIYNGLIGIQEELVSAGTNVYKNNLTFGNPTSNFRIVSTGSQSPTETGGVHADPSFAGWNPNCTGDYHLTLGSPAIDVGLNSQLLSTDYDGALRVQGSGVDIGPYEFGAAVSAGPDARAQQAAVAAAITALTNCLTYNAAARDANGRVPLPRGPALVCAAPTVSAQITALTTASNSLSTDLTALGF